MSLVTNSTPTSSLSSSSATTAELLLGTTSTSVLLDGMMGRLARPRAKSFTLIERVGTFIRPTGSQKTGNLSAITPSTNLNIQGLGISIYYRDSLELLPTQTQDGIDHLVGVELHPQWAVVTLGSAI